VRPNQCNRNNSLRDGGFSRGRTEILPLEREARALPGERKIRKQERAKPFGLSPGIAGEGKMDWAMTLYLISAALLLWFMYRTVKKSPGTFSKSALGKSFHTLGVLALLLIVFVTILVFLLRSN